VACESRQAFRAAEANLARVLCAEALLAADAFGLRACCFCGSVARRAAYDLKNSGKKIVGPDRADAPI